MFSSTLIDNFARRILAWQLAEKLSPLTTCELLRDAARYLGAGDTTPELCADPIVIENVNGDVNALVDQDLIHRVLAQVEVASSNSMIEAWWRSLRNSWLHLNTLDTVAAVRRLTSFYVSEHNAAIPHGAFHGATPDEMYFGTGTAVAATLAEQRARARQDRLAANRALTCTDCTLTVGDQPPEPSRADPPTALPRDGPEAV
jgi:putative transposase